MKYYFISFRIELGTQRPIYGNELINISPFEYVLHHRQYRKDGGGYTSYWDRQILYAQEITEEEYNKNLELNDD